MHSKHQRGLSRRNLIKVGAGALGTGVVAAGLSSQSVFGGQTVPKDPKDVTPDQALQMLMAGNSRFTLGKSKYPNQTLARLREVAQSQKPFAGILSCADSRVPSEIVFDQGLGDLFVCRVAGNIATPDEIGSLEFGTLVLGAKLIMVMGHERCGAVDATIKGAQVPGQIGTLIEAIQPAVKRSAGQPGNRLLNATKANVAIQIAKLKSSPVLSQLIQTGKLKIVGGYYDLDTGVVTLV
ncbi:Carbonic anhydrase, beta class [uncultured Synechococcales cyanobacterium]|uniref:carbonic anhydrase n=1 Tax=uncultured Synechococcales cyanobacterium TaxID=1936017 RepID=A0A6J4V7T0_9CYAN|nr:Carbonic anhydrase, beta class [uncultured Synechococcales cyanobacterium]